MDIKGQQLDLVKIIRKVYNPKMAGSREVKRNPEGNPNGNGKRDAEKIGHFLGLSTADTFQFGSKPKEKRPAIEPPVTQPEARTTKETPKQTERPYPDALGTLFEMPQTERREAANDGQEATRVTEIFTENELGGYEKTETRTETTEKRPESGESGIEITPIETNLEAPKVLQGAEIAVRATGNVAKGVGSRVVRRVRQVGLPMTEKKERKLKRKHLILATKVKNQKSIPYQIRGGSGVGLVGTTILAVQESSIAETIISSPPQIGIAAATALGIGVAGRGVYNRVTAVREVALNLRLDVNDAKIRRRKRKVGKIDNKIGRLEGIPPAHRTDKDEAKLRKLKARKEGQYR